MRRAIGPRYTELAMISAGVFAGQGLLDRLVHLRPVLGMNLVNGRRVVNLGA